MNTMKKNLWLLIVCLTLVIGSVFSVQAEATSITAPNTVSGHDYVLIIVSGEQSQLNLQYGSNTVLYIDQKTASGSTLSFTGVEPMSSEKSTAFIISDAGKTVYCEVINADCEILYDANGGSGAPAKQSVKAGEKLTLSSNVPTRTGYTFLGWSTNTSASAALYQPGKAYSFDESVTLYAIWEKETYTVIYDANGGSGAPAQQSVKYGEHLKISTTIPTRTGYTFLGWSTDAAASSAQYQPGKTYNFIASVTLYAVWKQDVYTITYNANGGSGAPAQQSVMAGYTLTLSTTTPALSGYTFLGWSTDASASTVQYQSGKTYSFTASVTLYAVWKQNPSAETVVTVQDLTLKQGETGNIVLNLSNCTGLAGYGLRLSYDANALSINEVVTGSAGSKFLLTPNTQTAGIVTILLSGSSNVSQNGELVIINVTVKEDAQPGDYALTLSYSAEDTIDSNGEEIPLNVVSGTLTLTEPWTPGDVNEDGTINNKDVIRVAKHVARLQDLTGIQLKIADVNNDGSINNKDVIKIAKHVAGIEKLDAAKVCATASGKASVQAVVSVGTAESTSGESITLPIKISGNNGLAGMRLILSYDEDKLDITEISAVDVGSKFTVYPNHVEKGRWEILFYTVKNISENGTLLNVTVSAKRGADCGSYPIALSYTREDTILADESEVAIDCKDGAYILKNIKVESIKLSPESATISFNPEGENKVSLTAKITPDNASNKNVIWSSSDESIATVKDGIVIFVKNGSATITAEAADGFGAKAETKITAFFEPIAVEKIKISSESTTIFFNPEGKNNVKLTAEITPKNASDKNVVWFSSNENIATVKNGVVSFVKAGTVTITAEANDGFGATAKVTITAKPILVNKIKLTPKTSKVEYKKDKSSISIKAVIEPTNAAKTDVKWSSSNTSVATVSSSGKVSFKKCGTVTITCKATDGSGVKASVKLTAFGTNSFKLCEKGNSKSLSLATNEKKAKTVLTIKKGNSVTLKAFQFKPSNVSNTSLVWKSLNTKVATVKNGTIKGVAKGTVVIQVSPENNPSLVYYFSVKVK